MCGIAGIIFRDKNQTDFPDFRKAFQLMQHRGPDHSGYWENENIGIYHHRLSIIDLSEASNQPYAADSMKVLSYNGEIYNYRELFKSKGIEDSDTMSLYHHICEKGEIGLEELNGIFAFAFLNRHDDSLLLARDRLGVKPLYYTLTDHYFAFASEAKVLYNRLEALSLNWQSIHEFLIHGSVINDENIVKGVHKVTPGCFMRFDIKEWSLEKKSFWCVKNNIVNRILKPTPTYNEAKVVTKDLLEKAIERQCRSDVSVGAYLSGGIDSSLVVGLASKYTDRPLKTFSAAFEGGLNSELPLARQVARKFKTEHHEFHITTRGIEDELKAIVFQYDDPFADPAAIPLHLMAKKCGEVTKVVLQGDGGDELFAGYGRHLDASEMLLRKLLYPVFSMLSLDERKRRTYKSRSTAVNASPLWRQLAYVVSGPYDKRVNDILNPDCKSQLKHTSAYFPYQQLAGEFDDLPFMQKLLNTDMQIILPYTFMEKVDKINMFHSIEARVPLLDNNVVDYVMRLPERYKIKKRTTKFLLRDIASDILPTDVLNARKQSFGTPMSVWLRTILYDFIKGIYQQTEYLSANPFNMEVLNKMLEDHVKGKEDNSGIIWRSSILLIWMEFYNDKIVIE